MSCSPSRHGYQHPLVDGVDGSGKSVFADQLAGVLREQDRPVVRASVDDFPRPRAERYRRGRNSPSGFWLDALHNHRLRHDLLDPLGPAGSRRHRTAVHDPGTDQHLDLPWVIAPLASCSCSMGCSYIATSCTLWSALRSAGA